MKTSHITGFLLAGGKSIRMKKDKGLVIFKGQHLAKYSLNILSNYCESTFINSNNLNYEQFGFKLVADKYINIGPLGGILTCLEFSSTKFNLFLPVDTPNISTEIINHLLQNIEKGDIIVPSYNGFIEPLIGIYKKEIHAQLTGFMASKKYKMIDILSSMNTFYVKIDELLKPGDQNPFKNVNEVNDLE